MNANGKLILFAVALLSVAGLAFLTACAPAGGSTSEIDSRVTKLENDLKANAEAIAKLQQQVQEQQRKVDALTPRAPAATTPTAPITPPTPITPTPAPVSPPKPSGILASSSVILGKLTLTPAQVNKGETVTMSIEVSNNSSVEGRYKVALIEKMTFPRADTDTLEYADLVTLKPGETRTVTFSTTKTVAGIYSVQVGTKVGEYTVVEPAEPPSS